MAQLSQSSWREGSYAGTPLKQEAFSSSLYDDDDESLELDVPRLMAPPPTRRRTTRRVNSESNGSVFTDDNTELGETTNDPKQLKGVQWPGMAMFDSATPEMKRKRNQKKEYSVIEQLQATSEFIEPTEMIFDNNNAFALRRSREITGDAEIDEDESPLSGEVTPEPEPVAAKKRPSRRSRPALTERNVNSGTGRITRRRAALMAAAARNQDADSKPAMRGPYYDGGASVDEDDNDVLTYGPPRRRRTGLSIHRDNTGPDITFPEPPQASANVLTSAFRSPFEQGPNAPQQQPSTFGQGQFGRMHQRPPSFSYVVGNGFRPQGIPHHPSGNQGFASFGHLNAQPQYQFGGLPQPPAIQNGQNALTAFQQTFGLGQQQPMYSRAPDSGMFQQQPVHNSPSTWDVFGFGPHDSHPGHGMEHVFQTAGLESNPLFFSSTHATPQEDDDATISAPASEH
jgi:hypothetical protein